MIEIFIIIFHVVAAFAVIALILLQQGKGADMGVSFGRGSSNTVFGSQGAGNFMSRATAIFATVFFLTSFGLAIIAKQKTSDISDIDDVPASEAVIESSDEPADIDSGAEDDSADIDDDIPEIPVESESDEAAIDVEDEPDTL